MRIGFDVAQTCVEKAGCGWYADALIRTMVEIAPSHEYYLYHQFGKWINTDVSKGTHIHAPSAASPFVNMSPAEAARLWASSEGIAGAIGTPEIVHANSSQAIKVPGSALVYTVYDTSFWAVPQFTTEENRILCERGLLDALQLADGFIFISQSARDEFERFLPGWMEANHRPWAVTPLGARAGFQPDSSEAKADFWLAVGSLEPRKNYDTLLEAIERYHARSTRKLRLHIAGGAGWKSDRLRLRIGEMESRGLVKHLSYVSDAELRALYTNARALIFPSFYEGFGLPVLEAMRCGCPVLSGNNTSLGEIGGDAAIRIDSTDAESIAAALLQFETSEEEFHARRGLSLKQSSRFSWQATATQTLEFYTQLLLKRSPLDRKSHTALLRTD